jgi:hypothetical protein
VETNSFSLQANRNFTQKKDLLTSLRDARLAVMQEKMQAELSV